ncbi:MAG: cytochrome c-type biogenesis protein CcmH [Marivibrio sp.]|uniref:cytochrome c-type biogenesis protein n=1 Tax=Marivibrio sp. TaxID=2039719 RepID=UPI0032EC3A6D
MTACGILRRCLLAAALAVGLVGGADAPAGAVQPDEVLDDPKLEERAREISKDVRCLVCQNQSIDDSNAELAQDLRVLVRERLKAGDSNAEVKSFLVDRYGQYILLKPPVTASTLLLWGAPALLLLFGAGAIVLWYRGRQREAATGLAGEAALSADERARIERLLSDGGRDEDRSGRS